MPDAPTNHLTPEAIQREKEARARSPLYWCSLTVTVHMYKAMNRAEQDRVNSECRQIERAKHTKKPAG